MSYMDDIALLRASSVDGPQIQRVLRLPDDRWSDVEVHFKLDDHATAKVTILLTGEQLEELAKIAHKRYDPQKGMIAAHPPEEE